MTRSLPPCSTSSSLKPHPNLSLFFVFKLLDSDPRYHLTKPILPPPTMPDQPTPIVTDEDIRRLQEDMEDAAPIALCDDDEDILDR